LYKIRKVANGDKHHSPARIAGNMREIQLLAEGEQPCIVICSTLSESENFHHRKPGVLRRAMMFVAVGLIGNL